MEQTHKLLLIESKSTIAQHWDRAPSVIFRKSIEVEVCHYFIKALVCEELANLLLYKTMTALNISTDIPTNINTLEKLAAWTGLALERCNPGKKILESPEAQPQRVAEAVLIRADDATHRMIIRVSIPINDGYAENSTVKFWQKCLRN